MLVSAQMSRQAYGHIVGATLQHDGIERRRFGDVVAVVARFSEGRLVPWRRRYFKLGVLEAGRYNWQRSLRAANCHAVGMRERNRRYINGNRSPL